MYYEDLITESNFRNDHRVRAQDKWYESFDERRMIIVVNLYDDDGNDVPHELPVKFDVCPTCRGNGSHVNPSIDCNGLSYDDFNEDPDFREEYMSGRYDVQCYGCDGKRVVPQIAEERFTQEHKDILAKLRQQQEDENDFRRIQEAERRMGA